MRKVINKTMELIPVLNKLLQCSCFVGSDLHVAWRIKTRHSARIGVRNDPGPNNSGGKYVFPLTSSCIRNHFVISFTRYPTKIKTISSCIMSAYIMTVVQSLYSIAVRNVHTILTLYELSNVCK